MRFYALRLHEVGMIKSTPNKIIAEGTDWRFLERAQARAEGVSRRGSPQGRRTVDATDAEPTRLRWPRLAGPAPPALLGGTPALADEGPPETTTHPPAA